MSVENVKKYLAKLTLPISVAVLLIAGSAIAGGLRSDQYESFEALSKVEVLNRDYRIKVESRGSGTTILGIHGGRIEFGTSEIATAIAGVEFNVYLFEGISIKDNWRLHITSSSFDEPQAIDLMKDSTAAISIHGFKEDSSRIVCVGGMNISLAKKLVNVLGGTNSWSVESPCLKFPANTKDNIVNRARCHGVQLEISSSLRKDLIEDHLLLKSFSESIRAILLQEESPSKMNIQSEPAVPTACSL